MTTETIHVEIKQQDSKDIKEEEDRYSEEEEESTTTTETNEIYEYRRERKIYILFSGNVTWKLLASTIRKYPRSLLYERMIDLTEEDNNEMFVDRSPHYFGWVHQFMTEDYSTLNQLTIEQNKNAYEEAKYYQLPMMQEWLSNHLMQQLFKTDEHEVQAACGQLLKQPIVQRWLQDKKPLTEKMILHNSAMILECYQKITEEKKKKKQRTGIRICSGLKQLFGCC